jgi:hypothetical protein
MSRRVSPHFDKPQPTGMQLGVEPLKRDERRNGDPLVTERVNSCSQQLTGKRAKSVDTEEAQCK